MQAGYIPEHELKKKQKNYDALPHIAEKTFFEESNFNRLGLIPSLVYLI